MRIAYLSCDHGIPVCGAKGAAVHIQEMLRAFSELGHEVELFAARLGGSPEGLGVSARKIRAAPFAASPSAEDESAQGQRRVKEQRYQAIADAIAEELVQAHRQRPFDLLYERYGLWSAAAARAGRRLGVPVVLEVNAPLRQEQARWRELAQVEEATALEREAFAGADLLVAVSTAVADYAIANGASPERVRVVPNGVDPKRFHPAVAPMPLPGAEGRTVLGFLGGLKPWHGLEHLMAAFQSLLARDPNLHLLIIGDGPMRPWIEGFAAGAGYADRLSITGWLDHAALPQALTRMDIATAPYPQLDDFYFSPLKLREYMAAGRPVVASGLGQIAEVIADGENGLLVPPGDTAALVAALARLCDQPDLRRRLGGAAARQAAEWTWTAQAERILAWAARREPAAAA